MYFSENFKIIFSTHCLYNESSLGSLKLKSDLIMTSPHPYTHAHHPALLLIALALVIAVQ